MKYVYITSARKNPDRNIKLSRDDELSYYCELDESSQLPDYYISFTNLPKIGVNPNNEYNTPIGIYTYPLRYIYNEIINNSVPFAGDRKYIQVLQLNTDKVLWGNNYLQSSCDKDVRKLQSLWNKERLKITVDSWEYAKIHLSEYIDRGELFERAAEFFLSGDGDYEEYEYDSEQDYKEACLDNLTFDDVLVAAQSLAISLARNTENGREKPVYVIWCLTHILSMLFFKGPSYTTKWNTLLQYLGYLVIVDEGLGFIHPHERTQALFLSVKGFKHVATIDNKRPISRVSDTRPSYLRKFYNLSEEEYNKFIQINPDIKKLKCKCSLSFDKTAKKIRISSTRGSEVKKINLRNFILNIDSYNCKIDKCYIINANIYFSIVDNSGIRTASVERTHTYNSDIKHSSFEHSHIEDSTLDYTNAYNCEIKNCTIKGSCVFDNTKFTKCKFVNKDKCDFINCTFE